MANTYTQIHIHTVFAVQSRHSVIHDTWKSELYKYITGIVKNNDHKLLIIGGMPDHVHMLIGLRPTQSLADLMQDVKGSSSKWINERKFLNAKFAWQQGYGAFACSHHQLPLLIDYIGNQEKHHQKKNFENEYIDLLNESGIKFDSRYIFKSFDD